MNTRDHANSIPVILFGAFDRHNFGDLLFPHIAAALLGGSRLHYAGLLEHDLKRYGGHRTHSLAQLMKHLGENAFHVLHVGGEILTCNAWEAAVMLLPDHAVQPTIRRLHACPQERMEWAKTYLHNDDLVPYCVARNTGAHVRNVCYNAVGGVALLQQEGALRNEVQNKLRQHNGVFVRDGQTLHALKSLGIEAQLMPDCAVMVAVLFGERIHRFALLGETAQVKAACPQGYVAMQFSADFKDDQSLENIAQQMDAIAHEKPYAFVLFRAGAAPWHDELECYQRLTRKIRRAKVHIFSSLNIWDICALIAHSQGYCGSSLHGRIVAMAFAKPRINFIHAEQLDQPCKQAAFVQTWEDKKTTGVVDLGRIAQGFCEALEVEPSRLQEIALTLAEDYRKGFALLKKVLLHD